MLDFLYIAVAWVLLRWHQAFTAMGLPADGGWTWTLSIIFLVITARLLLFRVFVKQVHYQRNMQKMQPKMQKLRERYKDDRAELNRQMMALQQEEGFNPLTGCLPMFLQFPVFIGLYHVLRHISNSVNYCQDPTQHPKILTQYTFTAANTCAASQARIFGAPLAASFRDSGATIHALLGDPTSTRILLAILLVISAGATFGTQVLVRRNQTQVAEGTAATMQRAMLYLIPLGTLASGLLFNFPLGVLLYWFTSNLWTFGQQAYIIKFHPPKDDEAAKPSPEAAKALAPRPGQRPVRMSKRPAGGGAGPDDPASGVELDASGTTQAHPAAAPSEGADHDGASRPAVPRPGQRPNRPAGKRPPSKRPAQTKKRR